MKLKVYRIVCLVMFSLLLLLGIFFSIYNIILAANGTRQDNGYLVYLIGMLVGVLFLGFEINFVVKSFKYGTSLIHALCLKNKTNEKRKSVLIVSSIILTLVIAFFIINILFYYKVIVAELVNPTMIDFNFYFCLIIMVNAAALIIYYLFIAIDDIEVVD